MNDRILSVNEVEKIKERLIKFGSYVNEYCEAMNYIIENFNSGGVVQSLYESGGFGESQKLKLIEIRNVFEKYKETICGPNGLQSETENFLYSQGARLRAQSDNPGGRVVK